MVIDALCYCRYNIFRCSVKIILTIVTFALGEMAERSNAAVLKTVDC